MRLDPARPRVLGVTRHEVVSMTLAHSADPGACLTVRKVGPLPWEVWDGSRWCSAVLQAALDELLAAFEGEVKP